MSGLTSFVPSRSAARLGGRSNVSRRAAYAGGGLQMVAPI